MKKSTLFTLSMVFYVFICFVLAGARLYFMFKPTFASEDTLRRDAEISAARNEPVAKAVAIDYLENTFENIDGDDITDIEWVENEGYCFLPISPPVLFSDGIGEMFFFTIYSEKDDLEFEVVINTGERKEIYDTYEKNLHRRELVVELFEKFEVLSDHIDEIHIEPGHGKPEVLLFEDLDADDYPVMADKLYQTLSRLNDTELNFMSENRSYEAVFIEFHVNQETLEYCKENIDILKELHAECVAMNKDLFEQDTRLGIEIIGSDGCSIQIGFKEDQGISIVDDSGDDNRYHESIDEFVLLDSYTPNQEDNDS